MQAFGEGPAKGSRSNDPLIGRVGNGYRFGLTASVMKGVRIGFIAICATLALLPLVGMIWAPTNETSENRELAPFPGLIDEDGANVEFLSELGDYFGDHFAYRSMFASAGATLSTQLRTSANPEVVILGEDGWLYYNGTLDDYLGQGLVSEHEAQNLAFDMSLIRDYCSLYGARFAVTIPPNKNTLYPEHMPYYLGDRAENQTLQMVSRAMGSKRVPFFDAYERISTADEVLYYLRDSHWNTNGARIAAEELLRCLGDSKAADRISDLDAEWSEDYVGDLNIMLYPDNAVPEYDAHFEDQLFWSKVEGETIEDGWIKTTSGARDADGTLVMFRDSFGNNMIQFLADAYETAYFTRETPFDVSLVSKLGATDVIFETVERSLDLMCANPAIMPAPLVIISEADIDHGAIDDVEAYDQVSVTVGDEYEVIEGCIPVQYANDDTTDIYIGIEKDGVRNWYVPFRVTISGSSYGYRAYIDKGNLEGSGNISVVVRNGNALKLVQTAG